MKQRWKAELAIPIAQDLCRQLSPFCERIAIAGSLRRRRPEAGDIEILYVPKIGEKPDGLFGSKSYSMADAEIERMLAEGMIAKRPNVNGSFTWGEKNKFAIDCATGIPIDFFSTPLENWWVYLVVRTGGKDTNLRLTTGAQKLGKSLNAYGCGVTNADGSVTPATSEEHVFDLCGVPYLKPWERA